MNSFERVLEYCEEIDQEPAKTLDTDPKEWPIQGEIQIADLTMAYHSKPEVDVLKNINLSIKAGEKIGVVGRTGSGKSTLAMAFFRIMEPKSGTIVIDGTGISLLIQTLPKLVFLLCEVICLSFLRKQTCLLALLDTICPWIPSIQMKNYGKHCILLA